MSDENTPNEIENEAPPVETTTVDKQAFANAAAAKNRRGLQRELAEAKAKAAAFDALQGQVAGLLESGLIDGVEDLDEFRSAAETTLAQHRSEKETFERNQAAIEKKLTLAQKLAEQTQSKYNTAMIQRSVSDDAMDMVVEGHGREGAIEYFQLKLGPLSEVQEDGSVLVKWKVTDADTGVVGEKLIPVKDALKDMESNPSKYGRYFKSTVNGGAGGETVDGVKRTPDGGIDFGNMGFEKFMEVRNKNPGLMRDAASKLEF